MGCPLLLTTDAWIICFACIWICALSLIESMTMVVAFLCTSHDINEMSIYLLLILSICICSDTILVITSQAIPTIIVIRERVWRNLIGLLRLCILSTIACVNMQILKTMYLIVSLKITCKVISTCQCFLQFKESKWILRSIVVIGIGPVWIAITSIYIRLIIAAKEF